MLALSAKQKQKTEPLLPTNQEELSTSSVFEKFLLGILGPQAPLETRDMQRALATFGFDLAPGPQVIECKEEKISVALCKARTLAEKEKGTGPYDIPLLINFDAISNRDTTTKKKDKNKHWGTLLVHVEPGVNDSQGKLSISCTTPVKMGPAEKRSMEKILNAACQCCSDPGHIAFPTYQVEGIRIKNNPPSAAFTYGYYALKNMAEYVSSETKEEVKENQTTAEQLKKLDSKQEKAILHCVRASLLGKHTLSNLEYETLSRDPRVTKIYS